MEENTEGALATAIYEGTRPLLLEIQALTAPTNIGFARRSSIGVESSRLSMIIAVLERKAGLTLINRDVYVNVVGGFRPEGTSTDLAVALAIYSNEKGIKISPRMAAIGEIGLTGELRPVQYADKLVKEADRMGFEVMLLPRRSKEKLTEKPKNLKLIGVTTLTEAVRALNS
jgi:DNA repair protein RadA/Sms